MAKDRISVNRTLLFVLVNIITPVDVNKLLTSQDNFTDPLIGSEGLEFSTVKIYG